MYYTRNRDLTYYETNRGRANCGSYALRLNEWYDPEDYVEDLTGDICDWLEELGEDGYSEYEIACMYTDTLAAGMLQEFEGELELCFGPPQCKSGMELIALNSFCAVEDGYVDWDFHFKVFRDGKWMEKNGTGPVQETNEDDWGKYNGDPLYMYHKIGDIA